MCGLAGEIRFDGRSADVGGLERMCARLAARGPDGSGIWANGPVALGHRRLSIIDLSAAGSQPMVDADLGLTVVFNGCIYNYQELRAELQRAGYRFFSTSDTEVIGKAYAEWGPACVEQFMGMFAFAIVERGTRPADPGPRPAGHQAAVPGPDRRPAAVRLDAAGAAGRRWHRHLDRPHRAGPLHELPLGRAGAADDPQRRPQAAAGHRAHRSSPTARSATTSTGDPEFTRDADRADWSRAGLAGRAARQPAHRGQAPDGRRRAGRGAAVRRHRLEHRRRAAGRGRADGPDDVQHRLRRRRRGVRRRVRVLRPGRQALRHRPPPDQDRQLAAAAGHRRRHRGDERADGQPRLRRVLPAQRGRLAGGQGRPVRPGRRRGARRLRLVPAAGRRAPRADAVEAYADVFFDRRYDALHAAAVPGLAARSTTRPPSTSPTSSAAPGARDRGGRRAAQRHHDHAGRRPGQAGRQHDHGLGAGGAGAVPRPRASSSWPAGSRPSSSSPSAARACSNTPAAASSPTR